MRKEKTKENYKTNGECTKGNGDCQTTRLENE